MIVKCECASLQALILWAASCEWLRVASMCVASQTIWKFWLGCYPNNLLVVSCQLWVNQSAGYDSYQPAHCFKSTNETK